MKLNKLLNEFDKNNSSSNKNNNIYLNNITNNNPPLQKLRCAIYTRKSCEDGLELEYNSLDNQYDTCLNFIRSHEADGWILSTDLNGASKRYDDGGFSGGTLDRPALKELMQDIQFGLIDKIIIYKLDRISRSNMDYYKLADILQKRNIDIEIATQDFDKTTSIGRFSFGMMLNFAQLEREMASDRIKDKIRRQQSLGMWTGGNVPIGYDVLDKKLIINEEESKIVKLIFNTFIKTKSINEVINALNEHNYKTKTRISKQTEQQTQQQKTKEGKNFSRHAIYQILKNKTYIGKIENKIINKVFDGIHEAVIDENTFNEVAEIIKNNINEKIYNVVDYNGINNNTNNTNNTNNNTKNNNIKTKKYFPKKDSPTPYLLRGLMKCDCCNSILTPIYTVKQKTGIVYRYYKSNKAMKHSTECNLGNVPANQIENIILNQVYAVLKSPSIVSGVISKLVGDNANSKNIKNSNIIKDNTINNNQSINPNEINLNEATIIKYLQNIEVVWNELFPKEQMQIVNTIIKEIIVSKINIKIVFNNNGVLKLLADAGQIDIKVINEINDSDENSNNINNKNYEINIPINFIHRSSRSFITTPDGKDITFINAETKRTTIQSKRDNAILFTLLQAESWKEELMNNNTNASNHNNINITKISHIACRENKEVSYVARVLNLVFLAPDIKKAILCDYAPLGLTLTDLYNCSDLDWANQRKKLRFV